MKLFISFVLSLFLLLFVSSMVSASKAPDMTDIQLKTANMSMPFMMNEGQFPDEVKYIAKTFSGSVYVTNAGQVIYLLPKRDEKGRIHKGRLSEIETSGKSRGVHGVAIKEELVGATIKDITASNETDTIFNYFIGNNPSKWKTGRNACEIVHLGQVYKGIGMQLRAYGNNVEKIFTVSPNTDPRQIEIALSGVDKINLYDKGMLQAETALGTVSFTRPVAYQEIGGTRKNIEISYEIKEGKRYGFRVGEYDREHSLVIDPLLASTYLGGSGDDRIYAVAVDVAGNVFVAGSTTSADFPIVAGGYAISRPGGESDAFVAKFNKALSSLLAMTFIGGAGSDDIFAMTLDTSGNPFIAGQTYSPDFPVTAGAFDATGNGLGDAFIAHLSNNLSTLVASTGLGGNSGDAVYSLASDKTGNIYVTGYTASSNFPVTGGTYQSTIAGKNDLFISKFNSGLTTLSASTYFGGNDADSGEAIAVDASGNIFVSGFTGSWINFPVTIGAYDTIFGGNYDAFISKFSNDLISLSASTFLGGSGYDNGYGMVLAPNGDVIVTGRTDSTNFPVTAGAYNTVKNGSMDIFVSRLDSALTTLSASTYLGGNNTDEGYALALDTSGIIYLSGYTSSSNFPVSANAYDKVLNGSSDAFIAKLNPGLTALPSATFLGGSGSEPLSIYSMAIDSANIIYFTGVTPSTDFPVRAGFDMTHNGLNDSFVSRLDPFLSSIAPAVDLTIKAVSASSIVLGWKDYNGTTVTGYKIERKPGTCAAGGVWTEIATVGAGVTTYTNPALSASATFSYKIRAYGAAGNSAYTSCVNATTAKVNTPVAAKGLTANSTAANTVSLTWTDVSTNETGFEVWRKAGTGVFTKLVSLGANVTDYQDTTANGNNATATYNYYITACNASGCSPASSTAIVPYAPANLQLVLKLSKQVSFKWTDKSSQETGYIVQRKAGSCSSPNAWATVATVAPNARGFSDTTVASVKTYSYVVRAQVKSLQLPAAIGNSLVSNCLSVTTP
jgi:hypothetical protein